MNYREEVNTTFYRLKLTAAILNMYKIALIKKKNENKLKFILKRLFAN